MKRRPLPFWSLAVLLCVLLHGLLPGGAAAQPPPVRKLVTGGVGLQVVPVATGEIVVIAVLAKSPAAQAKLLPGDLIVAVDGVALRGRNFADVTRTYLWGRAGSKVKIEWLRPGVAGKKRATLVRTPLKDDPAEDLNVKMLVPAGTPEQETTPP